MGKIAEALQANLPDRTIVVSFGSEVSRKSREAVFAELGQAGIRFRDESPVLAWDEVQKPQYERSLGPRNRWGALN